MPNQHTALPMPDRFWSKVNKAGPIPECRPDLGPCWTWTGGLSGGYRSFWDTPSRVVKAHKWAYENEVGPVPAGLELDHLCRTPSCVRPSHLEAVPHRTNVLRGIGPSAQHARLIHCKRGHEFAPETTRTSRGKRECRICIRAAAVGRPLSSSDTERRAAYAKTRRDEAKARGACTRCFKNTARSGITKCDTCARQS